MDFKSSIFFILNKSSSVDRKITLAIFVREASYLLLFPLIWPVLTQNSRFSKSESKAKKKTEKIPVLGVDRRFTIMN
jgi:hypothetical protein